MAYRLGFLGGAVAMAVTLVRPAQAAVSDATAAEALSQAATELLAQGFTSDACQKFRQAASLEPSASRFLALGTCWERAGRTASAWEAYRRASELAAPNEPERELAARQGETRLTPLLTRLQIDVPANAADTGLTIDLDGAHLARALHGVPVPVDPGPHYVRASAPGRQPWSLDVTLPGTASTTELSVPNLPLAPLAPSAPRLEPPVRVVAAAEADRDSAKPGQTQRTVGLVLGGVGIASLGTGIVFALSAEKARAKLDHSCVNDLCTAASREDVDAASRDATIANVGLGVGILSAGTGLVVYLLAPSAKRKPPPVRVIATADAHAAGLLAAGRF